MYLRRVNAIRRKIGSNISALDSLVLGKCSSHIYQNQRADWVSFTNIWPRKSPLTHMMETWRKAMFFTGFLARAANLWNEVGKCEWYNGEGVALPNMPSRPICNKRKVRVGRKKNFPLGPLPQRFSERKKIKFTREKNRVRWEEKGR